LDAVFFKLDERTDGQIFEANNRFSKFCEHFNKLAIVHSSPYKNLTSSRWFACPFSGNIYV